MYVCVHVCECGQAPATTHTWRSGHSVASWSFPSTSFETGLFCASAYARLAVLRALRFRLSLIALCSTGITVVPHVGLRLHTNVPVLVQRALSPTKPSLWSLYFVFHRTYISHSGLAKTLNTNAFGSLRAHIVLYV